MGVIDRGFNFYIGTSFCHSHLNGGNGIEHRVHEILVSLNAQTAIYDEFFLNHSPPRNYLYNRCCISFADVLGFYPRPKCLPQIYNLSTHRQTHTYTNAADLVKAPRQRSMTPDAASVTACSRWRDWPHPSFAAVHRMQWPQRP